ncbi:Pentatricopeptide repeat-containing protein [Actinidia chinensis var. chinensis]|uniref:Pentatricopeptide repeat-containing protein n=1 Tax=Actinidia chinensis var. chinensis TaxID=1590841 RepID=A0A2R6QXJ9_ACTCC|nr:Pentatricopeptide repeat-containing protein [Actinidia chinensis var. chinensis]
MSTSLTKISVSLFCFPDHFRRFPSTRLISSFQTLEESVRAAVEAKTYQQIPELIIASKESCLNPNPFSFLSTVPQQLRIQIVDEILQSFIPIRPRSRPQVAYSCLLSHTLQSPNPLPLTLAILQRTLRAGCIPVPQTHLLLSTAWLDRRSQCQSVSNILLEMQPIGYRPDSGICNYIISSLCAVDQLTEAVKVLNGMSGAGCVPDLESYDAVIGAMCAVRRTSAAAEKVKEMVAKIGLTPKQETVVKVVATMRANKQIWRAVEMVEFLEKAGFPVDFESYALAVEGCLECREFVLAGKIVVMMKGKGFIPYIRARQKVVEGLASIGEQEFASAVRQKFVELKS